MADSCTSNPRVQAAAAAQVPHFSGWHSPKSTRTVFPATGFFLLCFFQFVLEFLE